MTPQEPQVSPEPEARPARRRGSRGGRRRTGASEMTEAVEAAPVQPQESLIMHGEGPVAPPEPEAKPARRRGSRGGRRRPAAAEAPEAVEATPSPGPAPVSLVEVEARSPSRSTRGRRGKREEKPEAVVPVTEPAPVAEEAAPPARRPSPPVARVRLPTPLTGAPKGEVPAPFAHPAEYEFARILDFYGIDWDYEPRSFPLRWDRGHITEAFTPDFYLPDLDFYVELTTLKTGLTAEKNRKMRLLKELYPETNIILLKKRDYLRLLAKYGYGQLSPDQVPDVGRVLVTATRIQQRVGELGAQISRDYAGKEPVLIGVLRGVLCFMADLMRHISVPTSIDFMAISSYDGNGAAVVRILKDLDENIKGRDVILVEDIVDTGMTLHHILEYLNTKRPASLRVCALLDKRARRIADQPLDYVGFEVPDEFVVGYGLDFHQRFRGLPFIGVLKHDQLP